MSWTLFKEVDAPYLKWLRENPTGYVLNTYRSKGSPRVKVHLADCSYIKSTKGIPLNGYTARQDIKAVSLVIDDLFEFILEYKTGALFELTPCQGCKATKEVIRIERPPSEEISAVAYVEGATVRITVNAYERCTLARQACIKYYGAICAVCDFDFKDFYGPLGDGFIHVHHLRSLARIGASYRVDPIKDLRPVCPNCHSMLHRGVKEPRSLEELKAVVRRRSQK